MKVRNAFLFVIGLWVLLNVSRILFDRLSLEISVQNSILSFLFILYLVLVYKISWTPEIKIDLSINWGANSYILSVIGVLFFGVLSSIFSVLTKIFLDRPLPVVADYNQYFYDILFLVIIWPILEELFYRNFLVQNLFKVYSLRKTALLGAVFFSISHVGSGNGVFMQFFIGWFFSYIYLLGDKKILPIILLHMIMNLCILFLSTKPSFQEFLLTNELFGNILLALLLIFLFIASFIFLSKSFKLAIK
ncbi:MAG: type II CAAX endopeptidase family protein [Bacteroidota bacterium]